MMRVIHKAMSRSVNLAAVSDDKRSEDQSCTQGETPIFCYFDKSDKEQYRVVTTQNHIWLFKTNHATVDNTPKMYVVTKSGSLYVFNATVHSQLKAAKPVQSAGWVTYNKEDPSKMTIDNCSGHYSPTLSQFISTLIGMQRFYFLPHRFITKINKLTTIDVQDDRIKHFFIDRLNHCDADLEINIEFIEDMIVFSTPDHQKLEAVATAFFHHPLEENRGNNLSPLFPDSDESDDEVSPWVAGFSCPNSPIPQNDSTQDLDYRETSLSTRGLSFFSNRSPSIISHQAKTTPGLGEALISSYSNVPLV